MKYVHFDGEKVVGFYDPEIHSTIPEPNFTISDEVWIAYLSSQIDYKVLEGQLVYVPYVPPEPTPEQVHAEQLAALDAEYDPQRKALWDYLNLACNYWQDQDAADVIRAELDALEAECGQKAEAIFNGTGLNPGGGETLP